MNLKEFIEWHKTIDVYELSPKIADKTDNMFEETNKVLFFKI